MGSVLAVAMILSLLGTIGALVRWGEPWDVEFDDDPLLLPDL